MLVSENESVKSTQNIKLKEFSFDCLIMDVL